MFKISVTIATYNRAELLSRVLEAFSVQSLSDDLFEIIVCDSHSVDNTAGVVRDFAANNSSVNVIYAHTDNVLASKRNLGIQLAQGEYVVFLDDDCVVERNYLAKLNEICDSDVDGLNVYCGEVRFPESWVNSSNYYRFRDSRHYVYTEEVEDQRLDFKTIVVMNMMFKKSKFLDHIGSVNENFKGYGCEDQDLGWRLECAGYKIKKCGAKITHYEPSGDISGFSKKIFHTARDGATNLLQHNSEAFLAISSLKLLDKRYPFSSNTVRIGWLIFRTVIFQAFASRLISRFLVKTDGMPCFYHPALYRYVLGCAYIAGVEAAENYIASGDGWYD